MYQKIPHLQDTTQSHRAYHQKIHAVKAGHSLADFQAHRLDTSSRNQMHPVEASLDVNQLYIDLPLVNLLPHRLDLPKTHQPPFLEVVLLIFS